MLIPWRRFRVPQKGTPSFGIPYQFFYQFLAGFHTVVFHPSGRIAISGSDDNTIRLWDTITGEEIYRIEDHHDTIHDMAISADGRQLLVLSIDSDLRLWRIDRTLDELKIWLDTYRYQRDLTCIERETYRIKPFCDK